MMSQQKHIAHLVFWKLNAASAVEKNAQADQILAAFRALNGQVEGLMKLEVGQNCVAHPDAWDVSVYMVFSSLQSLAAYHTHPMHLSIKQLVAPMRLERGQIDFELLTSGPSFEQELP